MYNQTSHSVLLANYHSYAVSILQEYLKLFCEDVEARDTLR